MLQFNIIAVISLFINNPADLIISFLNMLFLTMSMLLVKVLSWKTAVLCLEAIVRRFKDVFHD